jgi:hypothetical protein
MTRARRDRRGNSREAGARALDHDRASVPCGTSTSVAATRPAAVLWLCSEGARFGVGVALPVDGGYTAA